MSQSKYWGKAQRLIAFREGWAWTRGEERLFRGLLRGYSPVLHIFSGKSTLGDIRIDKEKFPQITHQIEIKTEDMGFKLPFADQSQDAIIFDPPWINQYFKWASKETARLARRRIIAISGVFWFNVHSKAFKLKHIYVIKLAGPLAKLVFVYDRVVGRLTPDLEPRKL